MATTRYGRLTLIGSSHIAAGSVQEIRRIFSQTDPDIVAVELDRRRLAGLRDKAAKASGLQVLRAVGVKGFLFSLLGSWVQGRLGKVVGIEPGSEMLEAVSLAEKGGKELALIDRDILVTVSRLKAITWKEKWQFAKDLLEGVVHRRKGLPFDLRKVPPDEVVQSLLEEVRLKYPTLHRVLIDERNSHMARRLRRLLDARPDACVLAVVGAGHAEAIVALLQGTDGAEDGTDGLFSYTFSVG
ncbi:TraB/GumN family protein [Candidatus Woesearchaeota archaeon]|nr:TraB/GumN family protein [Candidatus Woesearchaeota archaeon]